MSKLIKMDMKHLKTGVKKQEIYVKILEKETGKIYIYNMMELTQNKETTKEEFFQFMMYWQNKYKEYKFMGFCNKRQLA